MQYRLIAPIVLLLLTVAATAVSAQDETTEQLWADYHLHYFRNDRQEFYGDAGVRFLMNASEWRKLYLRPTMRFHRWGKIDPAAGLGFFFTKNRLTPNTFELRPFIGITARWPRLGPLTFSNRVRLEYRPTWSSDGSFAQGGRLRYRLATRIPLKVAPVNLALDKFYMPISLEAFFDVGENVDVLFRDDGRFDIGLGYSAKDTWILELHLTVQQSRSGVDQDFKTSDYIVRIQVKHLLRAWDYRFTEDDLPEG